MSSENFLVLSGHDYRSARKANMHFITRELAKRGTTRMFSLGFSPLTDLRGRDPRLGQNIPVNAVGRHDGVDCFLWRTITHPFNLGASFLRGGEALMFEMYRNHAPQVLQDWARGATVILVESGLPVLFLSELKVWNPNARIIYIASDDLTTIKCAHYLSETFRRNAGAVSGARVPSPLLATAIPAPIHVFHVPHGIDALEVDEVESPYQSGLNAVSVGSMLFDADFFHRAVDAFPSITFHVIGSGKRASALPSSVVHYPEMPHRKTIPYIKYADLAIAPYRNASTPYYLSDTSMKLIQYGYFGIPSVCPYFAVGHSLSRFGYKPGDNLSIQNAIRAALSAPARGPEAAPLSWAEVTERILHPENYPEGALRNPPGQPSRLDWPSVASAAQ